MAGAGLLVLCAPLGSALAARLDPALWTPASLTNVTDNNLSTSLTNLQFSIDLGRTCTVDRVYLTGTNRMLQYWPDSQSATSPPLGLVTVAVGDSSPPTNPVGTFTVPYDAGNPADTEVDIRFSPVAGRYVSIQLQTNVVWGKSYWPGWTITPQPPAPTNLGWRVAELEIYGFPGTFSNRDAVVRATNSIASGNGFLFPLDIAAADLSYYLSELCGYPVPLITPGQTNLYPGRMYRIMDLAPLATNYSTMMMNITSGALPTNPVVSAVGREVQFSGWPYRCVVWGVWEFLERQGIRWVYPDAHGDSVPAGSGVSVSMLPLRCTPCARSIYANWGVASLEPWPPWEKQAVRQGFLYPWRNRWNSTSGSGYGPLGGSEIPANAAPDTLNTNYTERFDGYPHNLTTVLPDRILLQYTNWWGYDPAYGCRVNPTNENITFCMNNPDAVNWIAGKMVAVDAAYPVSSRYPLNLAHFNDVYNLLPIDSTRYCQDANWCLPANGPAAPVGDAWVTISTQSFSGSYYGLIAKVATNVSGQGCGAIVGGLAYADVYEPPANLVSLPGNVQVEVCMYGSPNLPILSPANANLKMAWDSWHAKCSRLATYDYSLLHVDYWQQDPRLPVPLVTAIVDRARYLAQLGALNGGCQGTPESFPYNPWNFYAYPRIRWNTNQTPDQILQEFSAGYFGEAAQPMLDYYNTLEAYLIAKNVDLRRHGYCYTLPPGGIPLAVLYGMQTNLLAAQTAATNWPTRQRIAYVADGFNWVLAQQGLAGANLNDLTPYQQIGSSPATLDLSTFTALHTIAGSSGTPWNNSATFNASPPYWEVMGKSSMQKTLNLAQAGTYTVAVRAKRSVYSNEGAEVLDITLGAATTNVLVSSTNYLTYTVNLAAGAGGQALFVDDWSASGFGVEVSSITLSLVKSYALQVGSPYGAPAPGVGVHTNDSGTVLTGTVTSSDSRGGTQYVCTGWAMSGNEPASGTSTSLVMTVTNSAVLSWLWGTNYFLTAASLGPGTVTPPPDWRPAAANVTLTATPSNYYHFGSWSGDTGECGMAGGVLTARMNRARSVQAAFCATVVTNGPAGTATPEWWLAAYYGQANFGLLNTNDTDGDGTPAWAEYIAGTDPTNPNSVFRILELEVRPLSNRISFYGTTNSGVMLPFGMRRSTNLLASWTLLPEVAIPRTNAVNGTNGWWDVSPPANGPVFYQTVASNAAAR